MGDYLGGTICVTEVCLLTTIVLMNNYETHASLLSEMVEMSIDFTRGVVSIQVITDNLINNDQTFALLKFVAVVTILAVWRSNVGHPPIVFVKKTATKDEKDEPPTSTDVQDSKSSELEAALLDSKQDFTSRYNVVRVYLDSLAKPGKFFFSLQ